MIKTLTKHGNSMALVIEKPILELLKIGIDTPLEISSDGKTLTISPTANTSREDRLSKSLEKTNQRYGKTLKKLAE